LGDNGTWEGMPTSRWNNTNMVTLTQGSAIVNVFQHFFNRGLAWWNHGCLSALVVAAHNLDESSFREIFWGDTYFTSNPKTLKDIITFT
jgi:hypothetical protein